MRLQCTVRDALGKFLHVGVGAERRHRIAGISIPGQVLLHRELQEDLEIYKARLVEQHDQHYAQRSLTEEEIADRLRAMGYIQ